MKNLLALAYVRYLSAKMNRQTVDKYRGVRKRVQCKGEPHPLQGNPNAPVSGPVLSRSKKIKFAFQVSEVITEVGAILRSRAGGGRGESTFSYGNSSGEGASATLRIFQLRTGEKRT